MKPSTHMFSCTAIVGAMLLPLAGHAAGDKTTMRGEPAPATASQALAPAANFRDSQQLKTRMAEKDRLQAALKKGQNKAYYTKALADQGYQITAVLKDDADGAEYEVVKGRDTWEVELAFDKAGKATDVEVQTNWWNADSTEAVLDGKKMTAPAAYVKGNERYNDAGRMKAFTDEKDRLEKALGVGHDRAHYAAEIKRMGYQVTSTLQDDADELVYEIVKGAETYEVEIEFANGKATDVSVGSNYWKSDATEKALGEHSS